MNKCILLSRVSTQQQTLEQQTNELLRFAKSHGYNKENIIIIEDKESAIKLDEEHRKGLIKMKERIAADSTINWVICYEISRISRQQTILFSIRDYLKERKIQLIILKPYMELLDEKGEITPTANIAFSLLSTISENEMMLKTERLQRGRRQKKSEGKYGGGKILLGYKIGEDEKIMVDEEKAKIIKKIFSMYEEGYSGGTIAREMLDRGWIDSKNTSAALILINRTLRNKRYIGINDGFDTQYPPIITAEQFYRCRDLVKNNIKSAPEKWPTLSKTVDGVKVDGKADYIWGIQADGTFGGEFQVTPGVISTSGKRFFWYYLYSYLTDQGYVLINGPF